MTIANKAKHFVTLAAAIAVVAASAFAYASPAGARATKPSEVDVVGSGTIKNLKGDEEWRCEIPHLLFHLRHLW